MKLLKLGANDVVVVGASKENVIRGKILHLYQKLNNFTKKVKVPGSRHIIYMVFSPKSRLTSQKFKQFHGVKITMVVLN